MKYRFCNHFGDESSGMQHMYRNRSFRSKDNSPFNRHLTHIRLLCKILNYAYIIAHTARVCNTF